MNVPHIISVALIEYDTAKPVINYLLKNAKISKEVKTESDIERSTFQFEDKETGEIILDTEIELLAIYYDKLNIWSWAWSQVGLTNADNYKSKEILIHALKLGSDLSYIKSVLTTSRGMIKDLTQIDINLAIASSFIKEPYVYPYVYTFDNQSLVYYYILLNRSQLEKISEKIK